MKIRINQWLNKDGCVDQLLRAVDVELEDCHGTSLALTPAVPGVATIEVSVSTKELPMNEAMKKRVIGYLNDLVECDGFARLGGAMTDIKFSEYLAQLHEDLHALDPDHKGETALQIMRSYLRCAEDVFEHSNWENLGLSRKEDVRKYIADMRQAIIDKELKS